MRTKSRRSRRKADLDVDVDVVSQLECAFRRPQATLIGALVGGLVPWFARTLAHVEVPATWSAGNHGLALIMIIVVLGCACFSALTVYKFGRAVFGDHRKSLGFTIALEGVMLVSTGATSTIALVVLILINAIGNGAVIAMAREATCRRREADARRAATRVRNRAPAPVVPSPRVPTPSRAPAASRPVVSPASTALVLPVWRRPSFGDVIDAEIVGEEIYS